MVRLSRLANKMGFFRKWYGGTWDFFESGTVVPGILGPPPSPLIASLTFFNSLLYSSVNPFFFVLTVEIFLILLQKSVEGVLHRPTVEVQSNCS